MRHFLCFVFIEAVLCASISKRAVNCPSVCHVVYDPVCGSNGKTYFNQCTLNIEKCKDNSLSLVHSGPCNGSQVHATCSTDICLAGYSPVCGTDGITYGNVCQLQATNCNGGVTVAHDGPCGPYL